MITHDLSKKSWGCNYEIMSLENNGYNAKIAGWHSGIRNGDYLLLKNGDGSTRYKVSSIRYCSDPEDMFFATIDFSPRE